MARKKSKKTKDSQNGEDSSGKALVIVESPAKVRTIKKVLGRDYVVKASVGHVRDLTKSKKKDEKDAIVIGIAKDFEPTYETLDSKRKVLDDLRKAAKDVETVYLCPDPDREGEAIAWHLKEALNLKAEQALRVTFDELTPRGIRAGFDHPRKIDMDLVNAQQARRVLDRIVGYKLSPLLWDKISRGLSAGRVQSVAVRLIVEREREIDEYQAQEYWKVAGRFAHAGQAFEAELRALDGRQVVSSADDLEKFRVQDDKVSVSGIQRALLGTVADAQAIVEALAGKSFEVSSYEEKEVQDRPYPPFATSQLQQAAVNKLGYDTKRTMRIAQQLYEGVPLGEAGPTALITYMRTDSFRIAPDALNECRAYVEKAFGDKYVPEKPNFYSSRKGSQDAHECIRPTNVSLAPDEVKKYLSDEQYKLYRLIWQRYVSSQLRPAVWNATTCDLAAQGAGTRNAVFRATGRVLKFEGWLVVYGGAQAVAATHLDASAADREKGDEETDEAEDKPSRKRKKGPQILPAMKTGDKPKADGIEAGQYFTQPKARFNEASLVKTLEREGIGRPSTYATIISTIQDRGYVEKVVFRGMLEVPDDVKGLELVSGSARGVANADTGTRVTLKIGKFECTVPKGKQLKTADPSKAPPPSQEPPFVKGTGGRGSFVPTSLGMVVNDSLVGHFDHSIMNLGFTRMMEAELDKIEEAHLDWKVVLQEFYGPFTEDLAEAKEGIVATKGKGELTDVECPECSAPMERRLNRYGLYLRCSKAPDCKGTLRLDAKGNIQAKAPNIPTGIKCDLCGSDVIRATGRFGPYLCCEKYPEKQCTFTMRINKEGRPLRKFAPIPTNLTCEKCKSPMVVRITWRGKTRKPFLSCSAYPKCRAAQDLPEELKKEGEIALAQWRDTDARNQADWQKLQANLAATESGNGNGHG
ncbi:MAG: type I DNA topoisomerase [Planctomycetes bacterium]|nr:type I DNA topoisomerase [Planctomycetota bacterium]